MKKEGLLFCLLVATSAGGAPIWTNHARQMGRSVAHRRDAVRALEKIPTLNQQLEQALATRDCHLALDVIGALGKTMLVPRLLTLTNTDEDGAIYLTLAALVNDQNIREIEGTFHDHLKRALKTPVPLVVQVILLDTLGRMGTRVDDAVLAAYFASPEVYVREAVLTHLDLQPERPVPSSISTLAPKDPSDRIQSFWKKWESRP